MLQVNTVIETFFSEEMLSYQKCNKFLKELEHISE
jgi:hypothetical protein